MNFYMAFPVLLSVLHPLILPCLPSFQAKYFCLIFPIFSLHSNFVLLYPSLEILLLPSQGLFLLSQFLKFPQVMHSHLMIWNQDPHPREHAVCVFLSTDYFAQYNML